MGSDPAGRLTVDPRTGDVTTVNTPDRVYTVILNEVDNGKTVCCWHGHKLNI